ncbi:hypothetical protein DFH06DRAFT_1074108 [Mycena polygramma]|nr:hypothetical protein DFH06DRAFT_1074108 [Mycena polygramma]
MASSFRRGARVVPPALKNATQIRLSNVPPTATPADLRRLITRAQVSGVEDVSISYFRLKPTGRALLKLTHSDFLLPSLDALQRVSISGLHPVAEPIDYWPTSDGMEGHKLSSELKCNGKNAVIWGLPKWAGPDKLDKLIQGFSFAPSKAHILKLAPPEAFTVSSRFMVRLSSVSEAHRLVRKLHMTHFDHETKGTQFPLRARVIY